MGFRGRGGGGWEWGWGWGFGGSGSGSGSSSGSGRGMRCAGHGNRGGRGLEPNRGGRYDPAAVDAHRAAFRPASDLVLKVELSFAGHLFCHGLLKTERGDGKREKGREEGGGGGS